MESGFIDDLRLVPVGVWLLPIQLVVCTAECAGEFLDIDSEVQMCFLFMQLINHLIQLMSMESVSLMEHLVTTSGPMLLVYYIRRRLHCSSRKLSMQ